MSRQNKKGTSDSPWEMTPMRVAAIALHEVYKEYQRAGFSKNESFRLVLEHVRVASSTPDDDNTNG